jgi:hypothetical protein
MSLYMYDVSRVGVGVRKKVTGLQIRPCFSFTNYITDLEEKPGIWLYVPRIVGNAYECVGLAMICIQKLAGWFALSLRPLESGSVNFKFNRVYLAIA